MVGVSGNAAMREIELGAVGDPNGAPVEVDGAGQHADAIGVIVIRLHPVVEPEHPGIRAAEIGGAPHLIANLQIQVRLSGHLRIAAAMECDHNENALFVRISAAVAGRPEMVNRRYFGWTVRRRRWRCGKVWGRRRRWRGWDGRRAVHLAVGVSPNAAMPEIGRDAVGVPNGAPIEVDGAGRHTDAVVIIVIRLHPVLEP